MFDFSKTDVATSASYLVPGIHRLKVSSVKADKTSGKSSDYLEFTFVNSGGVEFKEKFFLSEKALGRLQYLHQAWTGKLCDKKFKSVDEMVKYFTNFTKVAAKPVIVGGQINRDKVYAALPFTDFVLADDAVEEEFKEGDEMWKRYVTKSNQKSETEGKNDTILNSVGSDKGSSAEGESKESAEDDLPW